ncbi:hypothetical protein [Saccharopolyspora oryzae]|uniref:PE family protein n=1 Tax=Saccharopolyspora oryzae TaxID=2997343 RepID=A0ABT4UTL0_9PSEU|nr:hypothetical protein [Saccharopolyspora oryzae]MDA3625056.1 hypothetical protein [Saccharopolyspora oryzae]
MTTGMEGLAAGASALAGQAQGLRAAVDSGKLVMNPEAAEAVAKVYEDKAENFNRHLRDANQLVVNSVYGDCNIGRELERKFNEKVRGPGGGQGQDAAGLIPILRKMQEILKNMAQAYRDSAREIQGRDEEHARELKRNI